MLLVQLPLGCSHLLRFGKGRCARRLLLAGAINVTLAVKVEISIHGSHD